MTRLLDDDEPASSSTSLVATDPREAIVWIEALVSKVVIGEENPKRTATYLNGVVVAPDGVIAVAFDRSFHKPIKEASEGDDRERITISAFFSDRRRFEAKIVAFDDSSGVALLKIDASGLRYLECGSTVGIGQNVRYFSTSGLDGQVMVGPPNQTHVYETQVAGIARLPKDVPAGRFEINGSQVAGRSGVVVANDGTLVGLATKEYRKRSGGTVPRGLTIWFVSMQTPCSSCLPRNVS